MGTVDAEEESVFEMLLCAVIVGEPKSEITLGEVEVGTVSVDFFLFLSIVTLAKAVAKLGSECNAIFSGEGL